LCYIDIFIHLLEWILCSIKLSGKQTIGMEGTLEQVLQEAQISIEEPTQETKHLRLSELTSQIENALNSIFSSRGFWVIADVTSHSFKANSNTHHFDLVEKEANSSNIIAKVSAKAWGSGSTKIHQFERLTGQRFTNNIQVLLYVTVEYHASYGLKLNVNDIDPNFTIGALEQQRRLTLLRLVNENPDRIKKVGERYYTYNQGLKLNRVIQRIAVISSNASAGWEDFKDSLKKNQFGYKFQIDDYNCKVQGVGNEDMVAGKFIEVFNSNKPYDVVILTRGGGAQTDLLLFDTYKVGRVIARFPIPVITGIGHHKNESIADLMAHIATKTPTKAAETIIAHNRAYEDEMIAFQKSIIIKTQQLFSVHMQSLSNLNSVIVNQTRNIVNCRKDDLVRVNQITVNNTKSILFTKHRELTAISSQISSKPKIIVQTKLNDLKNVIGNIKSFNTILLRDQRAYLNHYKSVVKLMSPANILKKGFAIVKVDGAITSDVDNIKVGNTISIILSDSEIKTTVKSKSNYNGDDFNI
jgi:exodeoxyribonuclease VII large subunit